MIVYDLDGKEHDKDSVDVRECVETLGWTLKPKVKRKQKTKIIINNADSVESKE